MTRSSVRAAANRVALGMWLSRGLPVLLLCSFGASPAGAESAVFSNPTPFTIPSSGAASLYPSDILVSGVSGAVTAIRVTLQGVSHGFPDDLDVLLVGPAGQNVLLMSDTGGGSDLAGATLIFDDEAPTGLSDTSQITSGSYRPTNIGSGDALAAPAPASSAATTLATFGGSNANGLWSLYVFDDSALDQGSIAGWQLTVESETAAVFSNLTTVTLPDTSAGSPYPSTIQVAGLTEPISTLRVTLLNFTHSWPDDVDVLLVGPAGQNLVLMSDVGGEHDASGLTLSFEDGAAAALPDTTVITSGSRRPTNVGAGDPFPAPAPAASAATTLATFDGTDPNGTWSLYAVDDNGGDTGSIGGWQLRFVPEPGAAGGTVALLTVALCGRRHRQRGSPPRVESS